MKTTEGIFVKVIIVGYLLATCQTFPSSDVIKNNEDKVLKNFTEQITKSNNIDNIDLKRQDRSINATSNLVKNDTIIDDDLTLQVIQVTNFPTEISAQKNSNVLGLDLNKQPCGIPDIRPYFENTVNNIRRWLDSIVDECNKVEEITTENIEIIRNSCAQLKDNYFKLFQLIINPLNHLNGNLTVVNNSCPIIAGLENIKNNVMNFTLWPENIISRNNPFSNAIQIFRNLFLANYGTLPNTSASVNNSDVPTNISYPEKSTMDQRNIINNLRNLPQRIRQSIDKLISNVTNTINLHKCKELEAITNSSIKNQFNTFIQDKISCQNRFHELFKNVLPQNPLVQSLNNDLQNFSRQIRESIDKFISDVRSIFIPQNSKDVTTTTNRSTNGQLSNGTDTLVQNEFLLQTPLSGLFNNVWNISSSAKSSSNSFFNQALKKLQSMPQQIRESIDKFSKDVRSIFNSSNSAKSSNFFNQSLKNLRNMPQRIQESIDKFSSDIRSIFNSSNSAKSSNFFNQSLENLRNIPQRIQESIDKFIKDVRSIFKPQNSKDVITTTNRSTNGQLNNGTHTPVQREFLLQTPLSGLFNHVWNISSSAKSSSNSFFNQALKHLQSMPQQIRESIDKFSKDVRSIFNSSNSAKSSNFFNQSLENLRNMPQRIQESIDKFIRDVRLIFIPQNSKDVITATNRSTNGQLNNGTHTPVQREFSFQKPSNGLLFNIWNISSSAKSSSNNFFIQALDNLRNLPHQIREPIDKFSNNVRSIFNSSNSAKSSNFFNQALENLRNMPQRIQESIDKFSSDVRNIFNSSNSAKSSNFFNESLGNLRNMPQRIQESIDKFSNNVRSIFNFSNSAKSTSSNFVIQSLENLRNLPQQIRESIDQFISEVRNIFIPQGSKRVIAKTNDPISNQLNNEIDTSVQRGFSFWNPSNGVFKNIFNPSTSAESSFNNVFIQSLENLRNLPQQIRGSIDKFISEVRNIFISQDSKRVIAKTNDPISNQLNNVMNTFADKESVFRNLNEFFKTIYQFLTPKEFSSGDLLTQSLDNLRNLPQQISNSIDDLINNVVSIFTLNDRKKHRGMMNYPISNRINNANVNLIHKASTFQNFFNGLFKKSLPTQRVSSTRTDLPYLLALSKHKSFPRKRRNSYKCSSAKKCL
ncbi:MATH and LRR domain-containing protein PFE0570w-like [Microplitis mediator]|uniref:MATH and LRR domain-containing protein PFE0570w-like n=1 Tax=Microplitis mediator TaxID=375433 RepID=UPI00255462E1|nr:MATH and LRR domain-containing protein PFE0570w-like [Microplitis mediator]